MNKYLFLNFYKNKVVNFKCKLFYSTENKTSNNYINYTELANNRHFPPAIREWSNSVYNFNKNNSNYSVVKSNQLDKLINNYFNLSNDVMLARSKRMRYLRRKSRSGKFYLSKPEIKQNNDKVSITVYSLDRDNQRIAKKLFFFNKPKLSQKIFSLKKNTKIGKKYRTNISKLYNIHFSGVKYMKELKSFRKKNFLKNKRLKESLSFMLFKYILSIFGIQLFTPLFFPLRYRNKRFYYISKRKLKKENKKNILDIIKSNPKILYWIDYNTNTIDKIEEKDIKSNFLLKKLAQQRKVLNINQSVSKISYMFKLELNRKLWFIITKCIINDNITNVMLLKIFNKLSFSLGKIWKLNLYKKRVRKASKLINLFQYNLFKFKKLLPSLKRLIDNLFNKKTELNIVNLKYFYLNSDIFTKTLSSKIRKRTSALKVLVKSLNKVKPTIKLSDKRRVNMFNNLNFLSLNKNLSLNCLYKDVLPVSAENDYRQSKNILSSIFTRIYPNSNLNSNKYSIKYSKENYKVSEVLNTIKYKSLLGAWIEVKGRLTRRNTAARSAQYKIHKGDLKDKDQYIYLNKENYVPTVILRNNTRSNTQYTSKGSFRRIGSFGIKTWISSK